MQKSNKFQSISIKTYSNAGATNAYPTHDPPTIDVSCFTSAKIKHSKSIVRRNNTIE
jgi:hypothetical protein